VNFDFVKSQSEKGSAPLRRGKKTDEVGSPPQGQTSYRIGFKKVRSFLWDESGPTTIEYAIMLALIAGVCVGSVSTLASSVARSFDNSSNTIANAFNN